VYQPDGMTSAGFDYDRFTFVGVHAHERHDDGLVHNHNWAVSKSDDAMESFRAARSSSVLAGWTEVGRFADDSSDRQDDRYDDGLVHNHEWAVTGK
jgi:hypothetical protein